MIRKLYISLFLLCAVFLNAQISIDTINKTVDTTQKVRKKINKVTQLSRNRKLTNSDFDFIRNKLVEIASKSDKKSDLGYAYYQLGLLYSNQKKHNEAIKYSFEGLKISEAEKDTFLTAHLNHRLATSYYELKNNAYAKKYFYATLAISANIKNDEDVVWSLTSLGTIFKNENILDSALFYNKKALELRIKLKDKKGLATAYNNLGLVYKKKKDYDLALNYLNKALALRKELNDKKGMAGASINIGNVCIQKKDFRKALESIYYGTAIAREIKDGDFYKNGIDALANCYYDMKDYKMAADYRLKHKNTVDSIGTYEMDKQISELSAQYETGKKDSELALKEEQIKSKTAQNSKQKVLIIASCLALFMALIAVFFIYRSFKQNKKSAIQLAFKNKLIEEKNKEITDSINYARIIQQSLLAPVSVLDKNLRDYFILYKPKDIVSGDFYWAAEDDNGFTIACVDCTGHGVPGAFMSLIGKENLDKAHSKSNSPQKILSELNKGVKNSLNQNGANGTKDGMDAAIVRIQKNEGTTSLTYSGANRPLWVIRKNTLEVEEIKATKQAIGGFTDNDQVFEEQTIILYPGDSFYIFTDGYADQFGGDKQKKITTKLFKELLVKNRMSGLPTLKNLLDDFFINWKGNNEQIDDILVIGIKV
ncbi:MAG: nprA [Bacteroidetes bacterium]|nr:nprA [Bacteroidota bacterium]